MVQLFPTALQAVSAAFWICRYNLGFVRWWTARVGQVPDACLYGWCKLFPRESNKQTYYYVLMFRIIRVLVHALLVLLYSYMF